MNISFENKSILITGAGRGIGRELVKGFINCNAAKVYAVSKTKSHLDTLVNEVPANLGEIIPVQVDLDDWDATKKALEKIEPVDVLVNNAGVFIGESFGDVKPDSFDLMDVSPKTISGEMGVLYDCCVVGDFCNFTFERISEMDLVVIYVSDNFLDRMMEIRPDNEDVSPKTMALREHMVYCATKSALDSVTRVMALELGEHNIRVVSAGPTVVLTSMGRAGWSDQKKAKPMLDRIPLGRFAEVEEVVNPILFLASDKATMINGSMVPIDGGALAT